MIKYLIFNCIYFYNTIFYNLLYYKLIYIHVFIFFLFIYFWIYLLCKLKVLEEINLKNSKTTQILVIFYWNRIGFVGT